MNKSPISTEATKRLNEALCQLTNIMPNARGFKVDYKPHQIDFFISIYDSEHNQLDLPGDPTQLDLLGGAVFQILEEKYDEHIRQCTFEYNFLLDSSKAKLVFISNRKKIYFRVKMQDYLEFIKGGAKLSNEVSTSTNPRSIAISHKCREANILLQEAKETYEEYKQQFRIVICRIFKLWSLRGIVAYLHTDKTNDLNIYKVRPVESQEITKVFKSLKDWDNLEITSLEPMEVVSLIVANRMDTLELMEKAKYLQSPFQHNVYWVVNTVIEAFLQGVLIRHKQWSLEELSYWCDLEETFPPVLDHIRLVENLSPDQALLLADEKLNLLPIIPLARNVINAQDLNPYQILSYEIILERINSLIDCSINGKRNESYGIPKGIPPLISKPTLPSGLFKQWCEGILEPKECKELLTIIKSQNFPQYGWALLDCQLHPSDIENILIGVGTRNFRGVVPQKIYMRKLHLQEQT